MILSRRNAEVGLLLFLEKKAASDKEAAFLICIVQIISQSFQSHSMEPKP